MKRFDFYTAAAPVALVIGFLWVYASMVYLKVPAWPAMVGMAAYYAVGGLACHERHQNASRSILGLLLGAGLSWAGVAIWAAQFKGNPVAMGVVMGVLAGLFVLATKWRLGSGNRPFAAMPQAFLGATIYFGLFNTFMLAKGVPAAALFGWLAPVIAPGPVQPHAAGYLAIFAAIAGVILGYAHQRITFMFTADTA